MSSTHVVVFMIACNSITRIRCPLLASTGGLKHLLYISRVCKSLFVRTLFHVVLVQGTLMATAVKWDH